MKLIIDKNEYWIKDGIELPSNFDSMKNFEKKHYIFKNNLFHREDGPAEIHPDGTKYWYLNGKLHRIDGPAIIYYDGSEEWYLNDIRMNKRTYQKIQNSSEVELLVYMINPEYNGYLPLIEYKLSKNLTLIVNCTTTS